jgi:hypothetical protein
MRQGGLGGSRATASIAAWAPPLCGPSEFPAKLAEGCIWTCCAGFLFGWVRALMAVAMGVKPGQPLPPIILQQEHGEAYEQMQIPAEGVQRTEWICFEQLLWVSMGQGGHGA